MAIFILSALPTSCWLPTEQSTFKGRREVQPRHPHPGDPGRNANSLPFTIRGTRNLCGQAPRGICMRGQGAATWSSPGVSLHPDTHLALSPCPTSFLVTVPAAGVGRNEVGSGKGLLTQDFRMEKQRVWRRQPIPASSAQGN